MLCLCGKAERGFPLSALSNKKGALEGARRMDWIKW